MHGKYFFHAVSYWSILFSLAVFPTACFLPFLDHYSSGCGYISFPCGCFLSLAPILFRCTYFLLGCSYCLSLLGGSPLPRFSFTLSSLVCGSLSAAAVALTGPLFESSCLLPCFGLGCRCYLLTSPSLLYLHFLRGVFILGALAFSLYVSIRIACAS